MILLLHTLIVNAKSVKSPGSTRQCYQFTLYYILAVLDC